jgi:hypothetical protein
MADIYRSNTLDIIGKVEKKTKYQHLISSLEAENPPAKHGIKIQFPPHTKRPGVPQTVW